MSRSGCLGLLELFSAISCQMSRFQARASLVPVSLPFGSHRASCGTRRGPARVENRRSRSLESLVCNGYVLAETRVLSLPDRVEQATFKGQGRINMLCQARASHRRMAPPRASLTKLISFAVHAMLSNARFESRTSAQLDTKVYAGARSDSSTGMRHAACCFKTTRAWCEDLEHAEFQLVM